MRVVRQGDETEASGGRQRGRRERERRVAEIPAQVGGGVVGGEGSIIECGQRWVEGRPVRGGQLVLRVYASAHTQCTMRPSDLMSAVGKDPENGQDVIVCRELVCRGASATRSLRHPRALEHLPGLSRNQKHHIARAFRALSGAHGRLVGRPAVDSASVALTGGRSPRSQKVRSHACACPSSRAARAFRPESSSSIT
jgi:hypothetical protein